MTELIKVLAKLELYSGDKMREVPFYNGYRPIFEFKGARTKTSGRIDLIEMDNFPPGTIAEVQVTFIKGMISDKFFSKGEPFSISEGTHDIGKGEIIKLLG
jgi:translation elongation factor EF-Tu-like GTPase